MLKIEIIDKYFFHFQPGAHHRVRGKQVCRIIDNIYIFLLFSTENVSRSNRNVEQKKKKKTFYKQINIA